MNPKSLIINPIVSEYQCRVNLNLYDSPSCTSLATQAATGRHLRFLSPLVINDQRILDLSQASTGDHQKLGETNEEINNSESTDALEVCLCEDNYSGWLQIQDLQGIKEAIDPYRAIALSQAEIKDRLPTVIAFTQNAMRQPNYYLWGGTLGPNYDCSGLIQAAFASTGIWLPRDSYQQEVFTQSVAFEELLPGDLLFFATAEKVNHVALYLGEGRYIHSSGKETGRNGIAIDQLSENKDEVSKFYYQQLFSCGRVVCSFQP